ncbi:HAD family hydrolase [Streptococcus respiraculi]|uniref:HAD family hydrolase n=1 Tax=Streptococcus respiraculi TaxID=2021971 RepID=UPI0013C4A09D|nr:HAD-IA family hydrolase [Streptococcus respiraculi]
MIRWIFFDVGSTLVDEAVSYQRFANECALVLRDYGKQVSAAEFLEKMKEMAALGEAPIRSAWSWYGLLASLRPRWKHVDEIVYPDVIPTLNYLSQFYHLGIIANQGRGLEERLEVFGIRHFFDKIICSEEIGYKKPNRAIFDVALADANCRAEDAIYIGDRMDNDILPAKAVGMRTVHILQGIGPHDCPNTRLESDITIQQLSDLCSLF